MPPSSYGMQQPHRLEPLGEALGDARAQLVEALAGERRDLQRVGVAVREPPPAHRVDDVDLVHDELDRQVVGADLVQHAR